MTHKSRTPQTPDTNTKSHEFKHDFSSERTFRHLWGAYESLCGVSVWNILNIRVFPASLHLKALRALKAPGDRGVLRDLRELRELQVWKAPQSFKQDYSARAQSNSPARPWDAPKQLGGTMRAPESAGGSHRC